jgi:hypothetical protein
VYRLGYGMNDRSSVPGRFNDRIFLFAIAFRLALGPTQPPLQWVPGAITPVIKRSVLEADNSPASSAEVKSVWSYISTPLVLLHGVVFIEARDMFSCRGA